MKKIINMIVLGVALGLSSCNNWLTVHPITNKSESEMFKTQEGCELALNGVYSLLTETDLYGKNLSYGFINVLAQNLFLGTSKNSLFLQAEKYQYEESSLKNASSALFTKAYNCIANANNLIKNIDNVPISEFIGGEVAREAIRGEAMAARAFMHFDLLRLYAPSYLTDDNKVYLPYVDFFPTQFPKAHTVKEYVAKIIQDLESARGKLKMDCTEEHKNACSTSQFKAYRPLEDDENVNEYLKSYRATRFNYWAVTAILARVYLWSNNESLALECAEELIDESNTWEIVTKTNDYDASYSGYKRESEIVFGLWLEDLEEGTKDIYGSRYMDYALNNYLFMNYDSNFQEDDRFSFWSTRNYEEGGMFQYFGWYSNKTESHKFQNKIIPMVRITEMYLIAAECIYDKEPNKALEFVNKVRTSRNMQALESVWPSKADCQKYIAKESSVEFLCEGQGFYIYKRLNSEIINGYGVSISLGTKFILPIPDNNQIIQ